MSEYCTFKDCEKRSSPHSTCPKHTKYIKGEASYLFFLMKELEDYIPYSSYYGPTHEPRQHSGYEPEPRIGYLELETLLGKCFFYWKNYSNAQGNKPRLTPPSRPKSLRSREMETWLERNFHAVTRGYGAGNLMWDICTFSTEAELLLSPQFSDRFAGVCQCGTPCYASKNSGTARCPSCDDLLLVEENYEILLNQLRGTPLSIKKSSSALYSLGLRVTSRQIIWWARSGRISTYSLSKENKRSLLFGDVYNLSIDTKKHSKPIYLKMPEEKVRTMDDFFKCPDVQRYAANKLCSTFNFNNDELRCCEDTRYGKTRRAELKYQTTGGELLTVTIYDTGTGYEMTKVSRKELKRQK